MSITRRTVLSSGLAAGASLLATKASAAPTPGTAPAGTAPAAPAKAAPPSKLIVPNGSVLPYTLQGGIKIFHLRAAPLTHTLAPGLVIEAWGYNGSTPGPVIEATEGDRVRIYVTNALPERTSVHWHGVFVPWGMDGVAGLNQPPIEPGKTFR